MVCARAGGNIDDISAGDGFFYAPEDDARGTTMVASPVNISFRSGLLIEVSTSLDLRGCVGDVIEDVHEPGLGARAGADFGVA